MKRISIILLVLVGMSVSFVGIAAVVFYVTGAATSVEELRAMVSGTSRSAFMQDTLDDTAVLQQQKSELSRELERTRTKIEVLKKLTEIVSNPSDPAKAQQQASAIFSQLETRTAVEVLESLDDNVTTMLLSDIPERRATEILDAMDTARRAELIRKMTRK